MQFSQDSPLYMLRLQIMISVIIVILSMNIDFVSANRADTDERMHYWHFI